MYAFCCGGLSFSIAKATCQQSSPIHRQWLGASLELERSPTPSIHRMGILRGEQRIMVLNKWLASMVTVSLQYSTLVHWTHCLISKKTCRSERWPRPHPSPHSDAGDCETSARVWCGKSTWEVTCCTWWRHCFQMVLAVFPNYNSSRQTKPAFLGEDLGHIPYEL